MELEAPALRIEVFSLYIWRAESHVQKGNASDPGANGPVCPKLPRLSCQLESE